MAEEIHFKFGHFGNFEGSVTLTLTSDDIESHIVAHVLLTSANITYWLVATLRLILDGRTDMFSIMVGIISAHQQRWLKKCKQMNKA